uniref:Guanylate cyclase activator 2B n=1 Tax=Amphiprion percula TaxID=161767 RepID=A0A3P8TPR8_AMPPE
MLTLLQIKLTRVAILSSLFCRLTTLLHVPFQGWYIFPQSTRKIWIVGDESFPLEAVKQLKELMALNDNISPFAKTSVCANPLLPQVFHPVCQARGAGTTVFSKLAAVPLDICEICAFPACSGC